MFLSKQHTIISSPFGVVSGVTTIPLSQNHPIDYDCKKRSGVINFSKFTSYLASYPGSCHNSYVFSNMQIAQQPEKFFDQN
ncbi:hypothetical protein VP01_5663g2, partial [Puccinia sorghi]